MRFTKFIQWMVLPLPFGFINSGFADVASNVTWSYSCDANQECSVSQFVADRNVPNLEVGLIFTPNTQEITRLRVLVPLGSDLSRGVFLDLDGNGLGRADLAGCGSAGCFSDMDLSIFETIAFITAKEIGLTVWDDKTVPYRVPIRVGDLRAKLHSLLPKSKSLGSVYVAHVQDPKIEVLTNVQYTGTDRSVCTSNYSNALSVHINDSAALSKFIEDSNEELKGVLVSALDPGEDVFTANHVSNDRMSVVETIDKVAMEHASRVNVGLVEVGNVAIGKASDAKLVHCLKEGVQFRKIYDGTAANFLSMVNSSEYGNSSQVKDVRWISGISLSDGAQVRQASDDRDAAAEYALRIFSSIVIQRTLKEKYGISTSVER